MQWNITRQQVPQDGTLCRVLTEGGDERELVYEKNLWWLPDMSMYCYFTPRYWVSLDG